MYDVIYTWRAQASQFSGVRNTNQKWFNLTSRTVLKIALTQVLCGKFAPSVDSEIQHGQATVLAHPGRLCAKLGLTPLSAIYTDYAMVASRML